jgi:hypothetical protein
MKGKFVSAIVGLGAAAMFAVPGAASASTTTHAKPAHPGWGPGNSCEWRAVPWRLQGRFHWVQEGWGGDSRCVLVPWDGGGFGGGFGGNHGGFGGNHGGFGGNHGGFGGNHGGFGGKHGGFGGKKP